MPEPLRPFPVSPGQAASDRLDSWKDIAAYLGREVRTVQGWEKSEGLPVHRHQHARQGSVYAFKSELDAWRRQRATAPEPAPTAPPVEAPVQPAPKQRIWAYAAIAALLIAAGGAYSRWGHARPSQPGLSSVAVLPFLDLSPNKDQDYFTDGLTEEIIDSLSRVPNLRVVARTSAFQFKGKAYDIREIGKRLDVDTVLEGSVRKASGQLRITAQLNRASDGFHLWSKEYDRPLRDIFALQREISQAIAAQLGASQVAHRQPTADLEAYRLYQEGRHFFNQFDLQESYEKAIQRYKQAIQRDPNFALAYSGMADAYAYLAENLASPPNEVMPQAKAAAEKAIALDPLLGEAHTSLGIVLQDYEWNIPAADQEFRKGIELAPGSGYVTHWLGHAFEAQLRPQEAIEQMRKSLALDPLSEPTYWDLTGELLTAKRYSEALQLIRKGRELFPNNPLITAGEIGAYLEMGDVKRARELRDAWKPPPELEDSPQAIGADGYLAAREGRTAEARAALARLEKMRRTQYVDTPSVLQLCHALGDRDCVVRWLSRVYAQHSVTLPYIRAYFPETIAGIPEAEAIVDKVRRQ